MLVDCLMLVNFALRRLPAAALVVLPLLVGCGSPDAASDASSAGANAAGTAHVGGLVSNNAAKRPEAEILGLLDGGPRAILKANDLAELQNALGKEAGLRVALDMKSLAQSEIAGETAIEVPADAETLGEALDAALSEIRADYYLNDGGLVITSRGEVDAHMLTRRYDLSGADADYLDDLRRTLPDKVPGAHWAMMDGEGGEYAVDASSPGLFVTQTFRMQEQIRRLLSQKLGEPVLFKPAKPEEFPDQPALTFGNFGK